MYFAVCALARRLSPESRGHCRMETQTRASKSIHPIAWAAGIALILFSAVGIGAFMGWIPTSIGSPGDKAVLEKQSANTGAPARAKAQTAPVQRTTPVQHTAPVQVANSSAVPASTRCAECGVVESVREIDVKGAGSGLGAVGGAVVGGVLGNQVGAGRGKDVMTVVGAVGGAMAGNEVEKRVKSTKSYSITVRFDDGSSRVISAANAPTWRAGDKVKVINGVIQSNA